MRRLLSGTARVVVFKAFLASDHVSPATGKTIPIKISKNGGAFADPNAGATNATEIANGWYKVSLDSTDTNTIGDIVVRGTEGTIDPAEQVLEVVDAATLGSSNLNATVSSRATQTSVDTIDDFLDTEIATLLTNTTNIPAAILDLAAGVETGWTVREALRVMLAALAGPATGMGTFNVALRNPGDTKDRITATVDVSGNRSAIVYDKS